MDKSDTMSPILTRIVSAHSYIYSLSALSYSRIAWLGMIITPTIGLNIAINHKGLS
jgi:hypothetical protein